ncbi:MAG: pyruvate kinase [Thermoprotei archaeon]
MRRTKIVATVGPPSISLISKMNRYVDAFRLNFAHGDTAQHKQYFEIIRKKAPGKPILVDLPGPKLRLGLLPKPVELRRGQTVTFSKGGDGLPVDDDAFYSVIEPGSVVLLADSEVKVKITSVDGDRAEGKVLEGGKLTSRKGINIPKLKVKVGLTQSDKALLQEAMALGADAIGLSFVVSADEIREARKIYGSAFFIAKVEKADALKNLKSITEESNGVMVARGDLGVEVGLERLPAVQDRIIRVAREAGKPVILATQVLESMVSNSSPTRAEVIDVANSVSKGVDSIMLSDETAAGQNPMAAVKYLDGIVRKAELYLSPGPLPVARDENDAMAFAAINAAKISGAKAIVAHSRSGLTVARVARLRPDQPILAIVEDELKFRQARFYWGVIPSLAPSSKEVSELFSRSWNEAVKAKLAKKGEKVVVVAGDPTTREGVTNLLEIHEV